MLKKLGMLSVACLALFGCQLLQEEEVAPAPQQTYQLPAIKMPSSIIVCRAKQCAPAKLSMSKEFIYNTLLHMLDSNARKKALVCAADSVTHACTEEYVSIPITVGITPAYMYVDDVKITDVSISSKNTSALDLVLNWDVSYNGQTPTCRPSKTLLYAKNVNNVIMEDNGYACKMTTIGTSTIKTLFAIDYIDLDYGYIGGFYSIGLSGPAFGGDSGYMILRLPEEISLDPKDFQPIPQQKIKQKAKIDEKKAEKAKKIRDEKTQKEAKELPVAQAPNPMAQPIPSAPAQNPMAQVIPSAQVQNPMAQAPVIQEQYEYENIQTDNYAEPNKIPAPNVDTIIKYNHPSKDYDTAKLEIAKKRKAEAEAYAKWKKEQAEALEYEGVKVMPLPVQKVQEQNVQEPKAPTLKNKQSEYRRYE